MHSFEKGTLHVMFGLLLGLYLLYQEASTSKTKFLNQFSKLDCSKKNKNDHERWEPTINGNVKSNLVPYIKHE